MSKHIRSHFIRYLLIVLTLSLYAILSFQYQFFPFSSSGKSNCCLEKKRVLFIINPHAGNGETEYIEKIIQKRIDTKQFSYEIVKTKKPKHATELSKEAAKKKYDVVVAVGGDGTINEVAKGLIKSKTALGIIPAGSGNGLARHLKIPINPKEAIGVINKSHIKKIDTVKINDDAYFCVAGVGFDAHISSTFSSYGKRGFSSYLMIALNELSEYQPKEYELLVDGVLIKRSAFLISFANSNQYGNNAYIAPQAKIDDGLLDVLILKDFPSYATPKLVIDLFNKTIDHSKYIETIRCKEIILRPPFDEVHIDGEPAHFLGPLHIRIEPLSLNVITPSSIQE